MPRALAAALALVLTISNLSATHHIASAAHRECDEHSSATIATPGNALAHGPSAIEDSAGSDSRPDRVGAGQGCLAALHSQQHSTPLCAPLNLRPSVIAVAILATASEANPHRPTAELFRLAPKLSPPV